jgi:site-specific recombinase XerD
MRLSSAGKYGGAIWYDPRSKNRKRYRLYESVLRAVKEAARKVALAKLASCHTLRYSFAIHLVHDGYDVQTIQATIGHREVSPTTMYATC